MNNETQIVKGILEGCLLRIIGEQEIYGYKAVEILNAAGFAVNEATVYPILSRLQNKGFLRIEKRPSPYGPDRKYYFLTPEGEDCLKAFEKSWSKINNIVSNIMEGDRNDQA